ncbi:MAG: hypothetical protein ABJ249_00055 [Lentilitoribacter sp.]
MPLKQAAGQFSTLEGINALASFGFIFCSMALIEASVKVNSCDGGTVVLC